MLHNKDILITGAAGFIGANLVKELLKTVDGATVVGLDNLNDYYDVSIKENLNAITFDESNRRLLGADKDDEIFEYDLSGLKL